jgi:hypothetical protein
MEVGESWQAMIRQCDKIMWTLTCTPLVDNTATITWPVLTIYYSGDQGEIYRNGGGRVMAGDDATKLCGR